MGKRKRKERGIHPRNKYSENPPDFALLASLYPTFDPFLKYTPNGRPRIDWTDFNATRELTRVLLLHDHGLQWWIPDGQLCPTVPNRLNYIHWIEDLLASELIQCTRANNHHVVKGFDIGTGANCIYPLLGASLLGWSFIGSDVTDVAIEWANRNVRSNPHISEQIEIRRVQIEEKSQNLEENGSEEKNIDTHDVKAVDIRPQPSSSEIGPQPSSSGIRPQQLSNDVKAVEIGAQPSSSVEIGPQPSTTVGIRLQQSPNGMKALKIGPQPSSSVEIGPLPPTSDMKAVEIGPGPSSSLETRASTKSYHGPPILIGVVNEGETFDFCMCNPPFFESMDAAGLNPKTSCGGTRAEMVCPGGEQAFITRIIEDSIQLKHTFRWYTSMVGRKANLNALISKLWSLGATIVKTTEFVQGQTSRWGLAWSFLPPPRKIVLNHVPETNNLSFMLEGLQRQYGAFHVLQSIESFFGASCKLNTATFSVDITATKDQCDAILKTRKNEPAGYHHDLEKPNCTVGSPCQSDDLQFHISVFQQIPGTLLVKGTLQQRESSISGLFPIIFQHLEEVLKYKFSTGK